MAKHARARKVVIELEQRQESVSMTICDDGVGFGPGISSSPQPGKWGLVSMRQRAEAIGGRLRLEPNAGSGTIVGVELRR